MFVSGSCASRVDDFDDLAFTFDESKYYTLPPSYYLLDKSDP